MFSRTADSALHAVISAVEQARTAGMNVTGALAAAKLGEVDHLAAETARACALVNAALTVRDGLRDLPTHDRPLLARFVG
jgi:hypothetical protein